MNTPEQIFVAVLIVIGIGFQVRMFRELRSAKLKNKGGPNGGTGFYKFGLVFCCGVQALAANTYLAARISSSTTAVLVAGLTALLCVGLAYALATVVRSAG